MNAPANYTFDATQHDPSSGGGLPEGMHAVTVKGLEVQALKEGKGARLVAIFKAPAGEQHMGFNLWHNTSPQTVEIAQKELSALCHVTGVFRLDIPQAMIESAKAASVQNTEAKFPLPTAMNGRPLRIDVKNDGKYSHVAAILDANGNKPTRAGAGVAPATPVATAAPGAAAWGTPTTPPAGPQAAPAVPAAPVAASPAAPAAFPPAGWTQHPQSPGHYYKDQEVLTEQQLRAKMMPAAAAAPAAPSAPAAPAWAPPAAAAAPATVPGATPPWGAPAA